jgi:hypothetical protein
VEYASTQSLAGFVQSTSEKVFRSGVGLKLILPPKYEMLADVRIWSRLCENSKVGLARRTFASNKLNKKRKAL